MNIKLSAMAAKISAVFFFCITGLLAKAQMGNIQGHITTNDGQPASDVTVKIRNTTKLVLTDKDGNFSFYKIDPGPHTIIISFAGIKTEERIVNVTANQAAQLNIVLS